MFCPLILLTGLLVADKLPPSFRASLQCGNAEPRTSPLDPQVFCLSWKKIRIFGLILSNPVVWLRNSCLGEIKNETYLVRCGKWLGGTGDSHHAAVKTAANAIMSIWTKGFEECFQHLVEFMPCRIHAGLWKEIRPGTSKLYLIKCPVWTNHKK